MPARVRTMTPHELKARLDRGDALVLLDVRQPWEHDHGHIPGSVLMPLPEVPERFEELDPQAEIVAYCKIGERSAAAADFLVRRGFTNVANLAGGILAWADDIDPNVLP